MTSNLTPPRKHIGAHSELVACAFLFREGYEVFRNISACGLADLAAWKDSKLWLIDVKSGSPGAFAGGANRLSPEQRRAGVVSLCVDENGRCAFNPIQEQLNNHPPKLNTLLKAADLVTMIEKNPHLMGPSNQ
jgi:hypothetical protein